MVLVVALLVAAGFYVRNIVRSSFRDAEAIRVARTHVADMLNAQLDEETGMRGYVAAREPILLAPYYVGRRRFPAAAQRVASDLRRLNVTEALPPLRDAGAANRRWLHEVAVPLILTHGPAPRLELRGKTLVDRIRADGVAIDAALAGRAALDRRARPARNLFDRRVGAGLDLRNRPRRAHFHGAAVPARGAARTRA